MRKNILMGVITLLLCSIPSLGFTATYGKSLGERYMVVEGTIVSVDKAKNTFAIKDKADGKIYKLSARGVGSLNQGDYVSATVPLPGKLASKIHSSK